MSKQWVPTLTGTIHHQSVDRQERTHEHGGIMQPGMVLSLLQPTSPPAIPSSSSHLTGEDIQICLLGTCLLMTYVPSVGPRLIVSTPCYEQQGGLQWGVKWGVQDVSQIHRQHAMPRAAGQATRRW